MEASGWISLTKMANSQKIQGLVLAGDNRQLQPTVISHSPSIKINEFASQLTLSLMSRLIAGNTPMFHLITQHRMRSALAYFPNNRTYDGVKN